MPGSRRLVLALMVALASLVSATPIAAKTVRVDDDGRVGKTSCDGPNRAARTIGAGAQRVLHDGTVIVCPGTYRETVVLGKNMDGLTIRAARRHRAILLAPEGEYRTSVVQITITEDADRVRIIGLAFRYRPDLCWGTLGIHTMGRRVRLEDLSFVGATGCGRGGVSVSTTFSYSTRTASATVTGSQFLDLCGGVSVWNPGARVRVEDSTFESADEQSCGDTVHVSMSSGGTGDIVDSRFVGPAAPWFGTSASKAIVIEDSTGATVVGDEITGTDWAIFIRRSSAVLIAENDIDHVGSGISLAARASVVRDNTISQVKGGIAAWVDRGIGGGNRFERNVVVDAAVADCQDLQLDVSPNVWVDNVGAGNDDPDGICPPSDA